MQSRPIQFTQDFIDSNPNVYDLIDQKILSKALSYVLNSNYRKAILLRPWIEKQVENPSEELTEVARKCTSGDVDRTMQRILKWVYTNIKYEVDSKTYGAKEYWATAQETYDAKTGDCEDGAILIYVLARLANVPPNRIYIMAGDVYDPFRKRVAGHAWCVYKPTLFPLNWAFMDWCYYVNLNKVPSRNLYYVLKKQIYSSEQDDNKYRKMWFLFNEEKSNTQL